MKQEITILCWYANESEIDCTCISSLVNRCSNFPCLLVCLSCLHLLLLNSNEIEKHLWLRMRNRYRNIVSPFGFFVVLLFFLQIIRRSLACVRQLANNFCYAIILFVFGFSNLFCVFQKKKKKTQKNKWFVEKRKFMFTENYWLNQRNVCFA